MAAEREQPLPVLQAELLLERTPNRWSYLGGSEGAPFSGNSNVAILMYPTKISLGNLKKSKSNWIYKQRPYLRSFQNLLVWLSQHGGVVLRSDCESECMHLGKLGYRDNWQMSCFMRSFQEAMSTITNESEIRWLGGKKIFEWKHLLWGLFQKCSNIIMCQGFAERGSSSK